MEDKEILDINKNENKTISSIEDYESNNTHNEKNIALVYDTDSNFNSFYNSQNSFNTKDSKYYDKINEMVSKEYQSNDKVSLKKEDDYSFYNENNESNINEKNNFDINNINKEENDSKNPNKNIFGYYENLNKDSESYNINLNNNNSNKDIPPNNAENYQTNTPNNKNENKDSSLNDKINDKNTLNENSNIDKKEEINLHKCFICGTKNTSNPYLFEKCDHAICQDCFLIVCLVDVQYLNQLFQIHENKVYKFSCKCGKGNLEFSSDKLVTFLSEMDNSKSLEEKIKSEQMICVDCQNPAEVYCKECECFSCEECFKMAHPAKIKRLADHPRSKDFLNLDLKERKIKCSRDGGEYTLYCNSCNYLLCNVCKVSHSNHNIEPIPLIFKRFNEKFELIKGESINIQANNLNANNTLKNNKKYDTNNSILNSNEYIAKTIPNVSYSMSNNEIFNLDEKQTKNLIDYKKNVLNTCEQIIKMIKKLSSDFELAIDYEIKEKTNMNLIKKLISEKAENVTKNENSIYFLKYINYFAKNNSIKYIKSDLQYSVDLSILKTLENIKGNIPFIYPSNCLLKYSYLNKINIAPNDSGFGRLINENSKNEYFNKLKDQEETNKNIENDILNKNTSMKLIESNSLVKSMNIKLNNNSNSSKFYNTINGEKTNFKNEIENFIIHNPNLLKKSDSIKIENLHKNNTKRLYFENDTNIGLTPQSLHKVVISENDKRIKSVLITNYFDKMLLIYSIGNKFFLNDLEKQQLYYQSELSDDLINNIFFKTIQGIPLLIILGKKNCVFWDILTKQTVWKFSTDHFNFDSILLIDLEYEILGKNPNSPLNDETKIVIETYFNNLDFSTYLQNLSVIIWQSEYSGYNPFEYFYSDEICFKKKKIVWKYQ